MLRSQVGGRRFLSVSFRLARASVASNLSMRVAVIMETMAEPVNHREPDPLQRLALELERNRAEVERLTMVAAAARERMVQARQRLRKLQREVNEAIASLPSRAKV